LKNHRRFECFKISFANARNPWIATAAIIGCSQPVFNLISPNPMAMPPPHTPVSAAGHRESPSKAEGGSQTKPQALIPPPTKTSSPLQGFQREQYVQSFVVAEDSTPEIDGDVKAIAFYLPQFHPIPENDAWWGKGFTEWTNVTKSQPQFAGHHQPQLPGELGFYDLRLSEIRDQQAQLAREHGLHGFCYYYYWFSGRRILERPLQMMLDAGTPDFPFCICWANENWTRTWDGLEADVLLHQEHTPTSDLAFIKDVLPILKDPRYIRVNGAPLLLVYRVSLLPNPGRTSALWRQACREAGLETIHLCAVETAGTPEPQTIGFDSVAQFPPHNLQTRTCESTVDDLNPHFTGQIHDYEWTAAKEMNAPPPSYRRFRGVMPSWDNTARRGPASHIFVNSGPEAYEVWLKSVVDATKRDLPPSERFLFINAWNEWAEGAHLEPDQKFGRRYLEATRRALTRTSNWETLVEYARGQQGMSGAVLADWVGDIEAILRSQQLSLRYLTNPQQGTDGTERKEIIFSTHRAPSLTQRRGRSGGRGYLDYLGGSRLSPTLWPDQRTQSPFALAHAPRLLAAARKAIFPPRVAVDRHKVLHLSGWSFAEGVELGRTTDTTLVLENLATRQRWYGILTQRHARSDVAAAYHSAPESCTLFSGFSACADIRDLPAGTYRIGMEYQNGHQSILFMFRPRMCVA
jgi:hypothetical protein